MSLLLALGTVAQIRAPTYAPRLVPRPLDVSFAARNVALLTPVTALSLFEYDQPNPQRRRADRLADHIAGTNLGLLRPDVNPAKQYDWPNPQLTRRAQDHIQGTNLGLLRPDVNPAKQYDWPNPQLTRRAPDWLAATNLGLLRPDVNPFGQRDWPNPVRVPSRVADWIGQAIRAVVVAAPAAQYDWPNPRSATYPIGLRGWTNPKTAEVVVVGTPFAQTQWPNPRGPQYQISLWAQLGGTTNPLPVRTSDCLLLFEDVSGDLVLEDNTGFLALELCGPFFQIDWPNPVRARAQQRADWIWPATRPVAPVGTPFVQTDWPNPRAALDLSRYQKWTDWLSVLVVTDPLIAQYDWPNPRGARRSIDSYGWVQTITALNLPAVTNPPIRLYDWPNPRGAARSIDLYGWIQALSALNLPPPPVPPIAQRDWPNPRGAARGIDLYGWLQTLNALRLPAIVNPPIRQYDWPNPRGPVGSISLFGFSDYLAIFVEPEPTPPTVLQPGGASVPHTFSRKKWRELQMLIAAEMAAVAKAERLTKDSKREPLLKAARAAAAAVDAAEAEGENRRLDALLVRNAETIRRAIRAATQVKLQREVASAIEQSHAIVARRDEDEEDEMIALLMMS